MIQDVKVNTFTIVSFRCMSILNRYNCSIVVFKNELLFVCICIFVLMLFPCPSAARRSPAQTIRRLRLLSELFPWTNPLSCRKIRVLVGLLICLCRFEHLMIANVFLACFLQLLE